MYYLYICKFKLVPEYIKVGISTNLNERVNNHQQNWGEMDNGSIYFTLPSKEDMREVESIIKRLLRNHTDECKNLPIKDGYTEFYPVRFYDYIVNYISFNYICIGDSKVNNLVSNNLKLLEPVEINENKKLLELATLIKYLRLQRNISQTEMAKQAKVALNAVKRIESGKSATITTLLNILTVLGYTDWLHTLNTKVEMCNLYIGTKSGIRQRTHKNKGQ